MIAYVAHVCLSYIINLENLEILNLAMIKLHTHDELFLEFLEHLQQCL